MMLFMNRLFAIATLILGATMYPTASQAEIGVGVSFSKDEIQIIAEWRQHHGD